MGAGTDTPAPHPHARPPSSADQPPQQRQQQQQLQRQAEKLQEPQEDLHQALALPQHSGAAHGPGKAARFLADSRNPLNRLRASAAPSDISRCQFPVACVAVLLDVWPPRLPVPVLGSVAIARLPLQAM
jgi:hypothetical protein